MPTDRTYASNHKNLHSQPSSVKGMLLASQECLMVRKNGENAVEGRGMVRIKEKTKMPPMIHDTHISFATPQISFPHHPTRRSAHKPLEQ